MAKMLRMSDLFFVKRRPRWNVPRTYDPPTTPEAFNNALREHGFITEDDIAEYLGRVKPAMPNTNRVTAQDFATVRKDLEFLHSPDFIGQYFQNEQESAHYQNVYYGYQWWFAIFAILTTISTVLTLSVADQPAQSAARVTTAVLAAVAGAAATFLSTRMRSVQPQRRWYAARRRTEALRSHYFLYFAHSRPYRGTDYQRQRRLLSTVAQISTIGKLVSSTAEINAASTDEVASATSEHEEWETEFVKDSYIRRRFDRQIAWYRARVLEFETNSSFTTLTAGIMLSMTSVISVFSAFNEGEVFQVLIAVLPGVAATFVSVQQIYGWDRQIALYEDTLIRLNDVKIMLKLDDPTVDNEREVAEAVVAAEMVFTSESDQWGQDVLQAPSLNSRTALLDQLDETLDKISISDDLRATIRGLAESGVAKQRDRTGKTPVVRDPIVVPPLGMSAQSASTPDKPKDQP
jgi:hypothetical protein